MGTKYPWQEALEERIRASENEEPEKPAWQERLEAKIQQEKNAQALAYAQETAGSSQKAGEYIVNQVNDLIVQNTQAVTAAQQRYANRKNTPEDAYVADSETYFETLTQQQDLLYSQANEILDYLSSVENLFDKEWVSSVRKTVQAVQLQQAQMVINAENDNAYWKQWENADAYKVYQDQWNYTQMLQNMDTEAEEQKRAAEYSAVETKLAELQKMRAEAHEAAMNSSLPKEQTDALWAKVDRLDQRIATLAARSDYLYMDRPAEIYNAQMYQKFGTLQSNADWAQYSQQSVTPDRGMLDALNFNEEQHIYDALTEDEKKEYSYVYNKMGEEAAKEYLEYMSYTANARRMQGVQEWAQKFANDVPVLSDIASIPMNLVSGIGYLDLLGQEAQNLITGEYRPLDYNTMAMAPSVGATGIRGQRAENIQEAVKNSELLSVFGIDENTRDVLGKNAGGIYQLGMSMADSAAVAALGRIGIPTAVGSTLLAGSAATQGVRDAVARGASDEQALASGFMNGLFEWLFEKYEIDGLLGAIKEGKMGAVVRQAIVEGFGEGATSVANIVADAFIMKENSNWNLLRQQYKDSGMSDDMATLNAFKDMAIQVGMDTLGGMLMGGVSTGGAIAIGKATGAVQNTVNNYQVGKSIIQKTGGVEGLKNLAGSVSESATDSKAKKQIEKLAGKVTDKGGVHIANQINTGKLFSAIRDVAAQHSTEELARNLSEKGFDTERATQIAEAVHAVTTKKATAQQVKMLGQALADNNVAQAIMEVSEKPSAEVQQVKEFAQQMTADEQIDQGGEIVNPNIQNGGTENASTYEQPDTDGTGTGAGVLHGSSQRNVGTGTGEQTGGLDGSTERAAERTERLTGASRIKAAVARQNFARSLRIPKVSAQDIGLTKGTERRNLQVLPQENWDGELQALAQKVQNETGKKPVFVVGEIYVQGVDQQNHRIRAAITDSQVILQADYTKVSLDQLLDHEIYHFKKAFVQEGGYNLDATNFEAIMQQFTEDEYIAVLDAYLEALDGQYGLSEAKQLSTDDAYNEIVALIREEMMADAYAGINAFGAGAEKFTKAVNERMSELNLGKKTAQENGVRQTNGPNNDLVSGRIERFSLEDPVEERADLVAFHNITLQQLQEALSRNGLVMPSLAITNKGLDAFGEISLLFDKDTIDPEHNQQNKLYGADAWTPQQNTLKKNARFDKRKTAETVASIRNSIGEVYADDLFNVTATQFESAIRTADGNIFDVYAHDLGVQTAYAIEKGIITEIPGTAGAVDRAALRAQLNSELDTDEGWRQYRNWLRSISNNIILSYDVASNADILSNMQKQPATAKTFKLTENGELVVPAVEYASIEEVRRNKYRLSENAETETKAVASELLAFAKNIGDDTRAVVDAINSAFASRYSTAGIIADFKDQGIYLSQKEAEQLQALYRKAVELPTQYFEAKPGREVGLDEIKAAVMPQTYGNAKLGAVKSQLENMGVTVAEYREGDKESRKSAVNSFAMLRFSTDDADYMQRNHSREKRIAEILDSVSTNHAAQFERYTQLTKENPEQAVKESERLSRGIYGELFDEYRQLTEQRDWTKENTAKIGGERYSATEHEEYRKPITEQDVAILRSIGRKSVNAFSNEDLQKAQKWAYKFYQEMGTKSPFFRAWFGEWRENSDVPVSSVIENQSATLTNGRAKNRDVGIEMSWNAHDVIRETGVHAARDRVSVTAINQLPEIVENAVLLDSVVSMPTGNSKMQNTAFMHSFYSVYKTKDAMHVVKLYAEMALNNKGDTVFSRAYQLKDIKKIAVLGDGVLEGEPSLSGANTATISSISDLIDVVKRHDPDYKPNPSSKVVNEDGTPMVVYHGTSDRFTEFKYSELSSREGSFFFAQNREDAEAYTSNGRVMEVYVNLQNPIDYNDMPGEIYRLRDKSEQVEALKKLGYDGWMCDMDTGWGEVSAFYPEQIKSATDNIGTFGTGNRDIRYSTDDASEVAEKWTPKTDAEYLMDEAEYRQIKSELDAKDKQWRDNFLYNELGEEGAERYKATQKMLADREKAERAQRTKENRIQTGEVKLDVESRATEAKRLLENKLLKTFSIPDGLRGELRAYIGGFADRIVKHGALTEDDRRRFFARMYEAGAVTIPADDYYGEARSYIKGGHIYVSSDVVAEFGDDWQDIRRRAFAAGIYLTYERTDKNGHSVSGIDVWNSDLAADLPGLFDAEDTDKGTILRKIIHVAEQGKEEKISLAEYVARVAKEEYTSENDVLDSLERQMRWALESFAETAQVEIQLKDRNLRRVMKERQENRERAQRAKERRELQELQQKTLKSLQWLNKNRRLAPEELREEWNRALSDIDLYAVGAANEMNWSNKYQATWKDLAEMYKEARAKDPNFHEDAEIERIISRLDNKKIADMDPAALLDLYKLATGLRTAFYNRNNVLNDEQYRIFEEVYSDSKEELTEAGKKEKGIVDRFLNREQLSAMNVLERMAGWNPNSAWYSMAKQLERGERDVRAFTVKANRILEDYLNEHKDFVMRADGQGKDAVWYTIEVPELMEWGKGNKPIFGDTVTVYMTPAQKVHMYLESKNLDNLRHMEGGRTFVVDKELYGKGKRQEALAQGRTIRLAPETVKQLVSNLTEEEMELAQVLDQYYNGFATGEINRISNVLYGYDKAMGKHYAPIYTNQNYTNAEFGTFDVTAEGVGNMKGRVQYSKNPSYNISAFDAFERNVNQTARFVGMAIPIRNWTTLMNWTEHKNSMKDTITHSWGLEHERYIEKLLTDLQGGKLDREDVVSENGEKLLSNYISSVFGANMSIVLKQMGSIPLAGAYLGVGNIVPGQMQVERLDRALIGKYTQDLAWRGMGYSMPETKQLKDHPNWTQNNKVVRFAIGGGAITAMDQWAASVLWPWAENKVRKMYPDLEVGTQEQVNNGESPFYKKVAEEFENAVARSQSTSDQMHQGTLRKSKHTLTRMFTMFTSDSAQTYNTLRQMIGEARYYKNSGQPEKAKQLGRSVGAAVLALLLNALWGEGVNLLAALIKNKGKKYRDEEGEMTATSVLQQMSMGMLSSLSGTVVGGDTLIDLIASKIDGEKFYAPESMEVSLIQDMFNTADAAIDIIFGTIGDMAKVAGEGGDIGEYFKQNGNDLLGRVKDAALEFASYWGIPAANVEAYLVGALKFIPGFEAVYDGWFESADRSALNGLTGENLAIRVGSVLDQRGVEASDDTAEALAELYEGGFTGAVPGGVPSSVTIDGEERSLNIGQQQLYGRVWADVVAESLDKVVSSERFAEASPEIREGMLKRLYSYAAEQAKASMFDDYEPGKTKADIAAYEQAGLDVADYFAVKAGGHNTDKYLEAVTHGLPEEDVDDLMDEIEELTPMDGEDRVADVQRWRTCVDAFSKPMYQLAALASYMTDAQFQKAKVADDFGVDLSNFVRLYEIRAEYDENGNKPFSNAEYKKAIDSLGLSKQDSAVLWQLFSNAKSAKNNPYSTTVGQKVLDALAD